MFKKLVRLHVKCLYLLFSVCSIRELFVLLFKKYYIIYLFVYIIYCVDYDKKINYQSGLVQMPRIEIKQHLTIR